MNFVNQTIDWVLEFAAIKVVVSCLISQLG